MQVRLGGINWGAWVGNVMRIPKLYKCTRRREKRRDWWTDKNCLWLDLRSNWTPTNRQLLATLQLISVQLVHWSLGQVTTSVRIRVVFEYKLIFFCLCEHIFQLIWNLNYSFIIGKKIYKYLACTQYGLIKIYSRLCLELKPWWLCQVLSPILFKRWNPI